MAAAIGAGGLGSLAYQDGFQRGQKYSYLSSNDLYLNYCLCDSMAWGDTVAKKIDKR